MERVTATLVVLGLLNVFWGTDASSPVVLWTLKRIGGGAQTESNLNEFSSAQFADLVAWKSEHGSIPVIAFGLKSLKLEDLTPKTAVPGAEPFRNFQRIAGASAETVLFPAVQSAGESLSLLQQKGFHVVQINAGDPLPQIGNPSTILVILEKAGVRMDDEILRAYSRYSLDFPNLVGLLWGQQSKEPEHEENEVLTRKRRQAPAPSPNNNTDLFVFNDGKGLFLVFREVELTMFHNKDKNSVSFNTCTASTETKGANTTLLKLSFPPSTGGVKTTKFDLLFSLTNDTQPGYWKLEWANATLTGSDVKAFDFPNVRLSSATILWVAVTRSFHCSNFGSLWATKTKEFENLNQNHTFNIAIKGFQIQAFMDDVSAKENVFVEDYECVGFFTPGIWMGWSMAFLLIGMLSWGVFMLMELHTMDRFDDPKNPAIFGSNSD